MPVSHTPRHRMPRVGPQRTRLRDRLAIAAAAVRRVSLLLRFGMLSALLVAGLGIVLAAALEDTVETRALAQAEHTGARVARLAVQPQLHVSDFENGRIAPERLAELGSVLRGIGPDGEIARVKVFDRRGTLLFSDDPESIGERSTSAGLSVALGGGIASEIETEAHEASEQGLGSLLEVYVPVWMETSAAGGEEVVGAFEMYLPYGPIAQGVAADVRQLLWVLGLGLIALWVGLFQVMATASRRMRQHARANQWLAEHDSLTGLPNRSLFAERAGEAVSAAQRAGAGAAVLVLDLDRFKQVNEALGHHVGDALLCAVGERLCRRVPAGSTTARLSGDEYAVLLPMLTDPSAAAAVADDLLAGLRTPVDADGVVLEIDASIGIATYPEHADSGRELLQHADVALHEAKQNHDGVVVYRRELDVPTPARLALFGELRRAIDDGQLMLQYQPKVDVGQRRVTGVEALVRWQHPRHGLLAPADFIPLAERTGLIRPMTLHVLELAMRDCRSWRDMGLDLSVAVNLSARSFLDSDLAATVQSLLVRYGLPPEALELEITETTAMVDPGRALSVLVELRRLGLRLSVDDYGTGHSSLSYLHQLPVDTLKIDKSFVMTMDTNHHEATIVRSTIDLARNLGLQVVAEGVESEAAWRQLAHLGCDAAQGFWLARPGAAADVPRAVAALAERLAPRPMDRPTAPAAPRTAAQDTAA